jgi:hypothetical protein
MPVVNRIRAIRLNRADMRCIHLGASSAIDQLEAGYGAALVIGSESDPAKDAITNHARCQLQHAVTPLLEDIGRLPFLKPGQPAECAFARQKWLTIIKTAINDTIEVSIREIFDENGPVSREELLIGVGRAFGFHRSGPEFKSVVEAQLEHLIVQGQVSIEGGMIVFRS